MRALTMHLEGRGEAQTLATLLANRFNLTSREEIIAAVYHEKFDIASLAPVVLEAAARNDLVSQKILQQAAALLAEQVRVIVLRMGILRKVGLVFCGGLIDHETVYANVLHMKILKILPQVDIRPPLHPPAYGAVLMAIEQVKTP
jgi:N-acetylglucosamine kinase-like BadF-type ATPase